MTNRFAAFALASAFAVTGLAAAPASAQEIDLPAGAYQMDPTHATLTWEVRHMGLSHYVARIDTFDVELTLDPENITNSTVKATIDPTTVSTPFPGEKDFNGEISNDAKLLNAGEYPEITFVSTSVESTGDDTAKVTGDLTMLGVTKPVTLDVTLVGAVASHPFAKKPAVGFQATGVVDRTEFGMDFLAPQIVSPEVAITINAEFLAAE